MFLIVQVFFLCVQTVLQDSCRVVLGLFCGFGIL